MSASEDADEAQSTRPISVAELLARNGTIGAPPVGGHRRRRRGNNAAVTVAELTGEIPVIRDEPVAEVAVVEVEAEAVAEPEQEAAGAAVVVEEGAVTEAGAEPEAEPEREPEPEPEPEVEFELEAGAEAEPQAEAEPEPQPAAEPEVQPEPVAVTDVVVETVAEPEPVRPAPPLASNPRPRRGGGPERSYDPRPVRRSSGAEQMAYDPVDESVDLAELVGDQAAEEEQLRSYLKSSGGTLFSGETVADDLARRGIGDDDAGEGLPAAGASTPPRKSGTSAGGRLAALRHGVVALLQSVLAVVFGAGLFLAFDQLWRWNTIVALVLSVLVILGLVVAVRVVRKTEDIASTLIAVAVGALVTLGPLALLQSYG